MKLKQFRDIIGKSAGICLAGLLLGQTAALAEIVSPSRQTTWQGNVGIPGGIPINRPIFVNVGTTTNTRYKCVGDGSTDNNAAIANAIADCPADQVIYFPAGTYRVSGAIRVYTKSHWTIRGAGAGKTIFTGGGSALFAMGSVPWLAQWPAPNAVTGGATKGSTSVTVAGTTGLVVGQLMVIEEDNDNFTVFGSGAGSGSGAMNTDDRMNNNQAVMNERVMVTGISGNTVTFNPPLNYGFNPSLNPRVVGFAGIVGPTFSGLEDLTVNGNSNGESVNLQGCYAFWLKNVEITGWAYFGFHMQWCASIEVRGCSWHDPATYGWSRGYAIQYDAVNNTLFEDNIIWHNQAGFMIQGGSSGNVFGYNCCFQAYNVYIGIDWEGSSIEAHTPYPCMNLFEGNYANGLHFDFYYGPSGTATLLRNYFTGTDPDILQNRYCISFDSHQWSNSVVGNILGSIGTHGPIYSAFAGRTISWANTTPLTWTYDPGTRGFSLSENVIYRLGYPNSGNNGSSGTSSDGSHANWTAIDLTVRSNTLLHGNWDYSHQAIVWDPTIADHNIPNSYYLPGKPAWFGNLPWPPFDPSTPGRAEITNVPAGYRFVYGTNPPAGGPPNLPPTVVAYGSPRTGPAPLAVTFSGSGSSDPEGAALTYNWNFGDGTFSTAANPSHTYSAAGSYTAQVAVSDGANTVSSTNISITVTPVGGNSPPTAVAGANPTSGTAPLAVSFTSAGSSDPEGAALTYNWTFGDGSTSTAANPSHIYQAAGTFAAQLTVSDGTNTSAPSPVTIQAIPLPPTNLRALR